MATQLPVNTSVSALKGRRADQRMQVRGRIVDRMNSDCRAARFIALIIINALNHWFYQTSQFPLITNTPEMYGERTPNCSKNKECERRGRV